MALPKKEQTDTRLVTQDNALIEACYGLTLNEKRLILLGISRVNSMSKPNRENPLSFSITSSDWKAAYPDAENPLREMLRAAEDLQAKHVKMRPKTGVFRLVNWVDRVDLYKTESRLELHFGWTMSGYLQGMVEQFTSYDLLSVRKLGSTHSIRIYELLIQFKTTGFRVETLENLRFALDCVGSYPRWADFDKWVIRRAVADINAKSTLRVRYKTVVRSRKVVGVEFTFSEEKQTDLFGKP